MNPLHKLFFLTLVLSSSVACAQNSKFQLDKNEFRNDSIVLNGPFFKINKFSYDFSKLDKPFSIYNPHPGFNSMVASRSYYSFANTTRLLSYEMKNIEKEPIFPDVKKVTLGEAVFSQVLDAIFDK